MDKLIARLLPIQAKTKTQGKALAIILIIIAVIIIIGGILIFYFTSGFTHEARAQLDDIKAGNLDAAYYMTSTGFQKEVPIDTFKRLINEHPILKNFKNVSFTEKKVENGLAYIAGTIEDQDNTVMKIEYQFVKEDGKWKIQAFRLSKPE